MRDGGAHSATGRGQSHFYFHSCTAIFFVDQATIVNQTKIDNIHRDFWIITLPQLVPDIFLRNFAICACSFLGFLRLRLFQTERVEVLLRDSCEALISCDSVASTKALGDDTLSSSRDRGFLSARNLDRFAITAQCEFSVLVHGFNVDTVLCHRCEK